MLDLYQTALETANALGCILMGVSLCAYVQKWVPRLILPRLCVADVGSLLVAFVVFCLPGVNRIAFYLWIVRSVFGSIYHATVFGAPLFGFFTFAIPVLCYHALYALRHRCAWLNRFRVSDRNHPRDSPSEQVRNAYRTLEWKALLYVIKISLMMDVLMLFPQLCRLGWYVKDDDPRIAESHPNALPTSAWHIIVSVTSYVLVIDFCSYWMHRLVHSYPCLYRYHKRHHEFHEVSILAAAYTHPIDILLTFILPMLVGMLIVRPHTMIAWQVLFAKQLHFAYDHGGYAPEVHPWGWLLSPLPLCRNSVHHDLHHSRNTGNYSAHYTIFDRLFGSFIPPIHTK